MEQRIKRDCCPSKYDDQKYNYDCFCELNYDVYRACGHEIPTKVVKCDERRHGYLADWHNVPAMLGEVTDKPGLCRACKLCRCSHHRRFCLKCGKCIRALFFPCFLEQHKPQQLIPFKDDRGTKELCRECESSQES